MSPRPPQPPRSRWIRVTRILFGPQIRAWRGEAPVGQVIWGQGLLPSLVLIAAYVDAVYRHDLITQQGALSAFQLYSGWVLVAIWRCAAKSPPPWDTIARLLTIAWAGNVLPVTGFLQLALLTR